MKESFKVRVMIGKWINRMKIDDTAKYIISWDKWAYSKIPLFFAIMLYIAIVDMKHNIHFIYQLFLFTILISLYFALTHVINNFYDADYDIISKNINVFEIWSRKAYYYLMLALIFLNISLSIIISSDFFANSYLFIIVFIIASTVSILYSAPPIRFKERSLQGIIAASFIEHVFPILLILIAFNHLEEYDSIIILIYSFSVGMELIIDHQIADYDNDRAANIRTFAIEYSLKKSKKLYNIFYSIEKITLLSLLLYMIYIGYLIILPLVIPYIFYLFFSNYSNYINKKDVGILFYFSRRIIPLYFSILLFFTNIYFIYLIFFIVIWNITLDIAKLMGVTRHE